MVVQFHPPSGRPPAAKRQGADLPDHDIVVDGTVIPAREIAAEMQHHPAATPEASWNAAARALVIRHLLEAAAAARGLDPQDEESFDALLAAEVPVPSVDEAAARRWYAAHPERFGEPELWEASHILIAADPDDPSASAAALGRALALLAEVQSDPSRLPALARLHSDCPSREDGGHLGQLARGSAAPELGAALAALAPGEVCSKVVATRSGMHVVQLHAHVPPTIPGFETIAARVAADLRAQSWREGVRQFIATLVSHARIEGFTFEGAAAVSFVQ